MGTKSQSGAGASMKARRFAIGDHVRSVHGHPGEIVGVLKTKPRQYRVKWKLTGNTTTVSPLNLVSDRSPNGPR